MGDGLTRIFCFDPEQLKDKFFGSLKSNVNVSDEKPSELGMTDWGKHGESERVRNGRSRT